MCSNIDRQESDMKTFSLSANRLVLALLAAGVVGGAGVALTDGVRIG